LRIVRTPDGTVAVDPTGRLPGRGAYVCDDPACRTRAAGPGFLTRALGTPFPAELAAALAADASTMTNTNPNPNTNTNQGGTNGTK
jgi:predicted RNA-binding protein YlxR (DUF448 family)